jgi:dGTPase
MSDDIYGAMTKLREFLYDNVYRSPEVHNEFVKAKKILSELYSYFVKDEKMFHRELTNMEMSAIYRKKHLGEETYERIVCDLIASITDRYALDLYSKLFFPSPLV